MWTSIRNVKFFKNALEYNVYHRCLCNFLHFTYMLLWFRLIIPSFPAQIDDMRSRFSALSCWPILVPRGRAPFGQHQESRPLALSNDILVLNGFVNTIDWDQNQSDLADLALSMRRGTGSPSIADFRFWTRPEVNTAAKRLRMRHILPFPVYTRCSF